MAAEKLTDFKDWIAPMIVKELRQGTRTRTFAVAFILLQAALIIVMLASLADGGDSEGSTAWFWFCISATFMVVMPLRGFGAVSNEMRMGTMDLILLTRQSSWRIMFGKWAALFSQTLLIAAALLPFVVIRYFLGGVSMIDELVWLLILTINSGVFSALAVGMSAQQSAILRVASALGIIFAGMIMFGVGIMENMMRGLGVGGFFGTSEFWLTIAVYALVAAFATYYLLDMGATFFAPVAENHSTRKRLIAFVFMVATLGSAVFDIDEEIVFGLAGIPMIVVMIDALTEHPAPVASIYVPFVNRGPLARFAGRFLYPGWQTGLFYALIVTIVLGFFIIVVQEFDEPADYAILIGIFGTILFPVVIKELLFRRYPNPFALYIFIQLIVILGGWMLFLIDDGMRTSTFLWTLSPIPFIGLLIASASHSYDSEETILALNCVSTAVCFLILFLRALPIQRRIRQLEDVVKKMIAREGAAFAGPASAKPSAPASTESRDPGS